MAKPIRSAPGAVRTETRNSPIPRQAAPPQSSSSKPAARQVSHEQIARRAYEISQAPGAGSEFDNWIRAERELKAGK